METLESESPQLETLGLKSFPAAEVSSFMLVVRRHPNGSRQVGYLAGRIYSKTISQKRCCAAEVSSLHPPFVVLEMLGSPQMDKVLVGLRRRVLEVLIGIV